MRERERERERERKGSRRGRENVVGIASGVCKGSKGTRLRKEEEIWPGRRARGDGCAR